MQHDGGEGLEREAAGPAGRDVLRTAHEARLQQVGRMLAGIVHEIRNPLAVIQGYAQLLHEQVTEPAARQDVAHILHEVQRLASIVDDMLTFVRRDGAERIGSVDLGRVIQAAIALTAHSMRQGRVSVTVVSAGAPALVSGQLGAYIQVVLNLLDNARASLEESTQVERRITLRVDAAPGRHVVRVANNGPPIRPEHAQRIFESFFTTRGEGRGTGLGLALCREILGRFGGSLELEHAGGASQPVTFRMELPNA